MNRLLCALFLLLPPAALAAPSPVPEDAAGGAPGGAVTATCALAPGGLGSTSFIWTPPEELTSWTQGATCLVPDPAQVLCGPITQTISGTGNGTVFHTINFPNECCIPANSFVRIRFSGLGNCANGGTGPGLAASTAACQPCTQFVTASNIFENTSEWCGEVGASNATWLSLAVDCCSVVPVKDRTWGAVRALYR